MNQVQMRLPMPGKLDPEALVGQEITVRDLDGDPHPGRIVAAAHAEDEGFMDVLIETLAPIPKPDVSMLSIGKAPELRQPDFGRYEVFDYSKGRW